MLSKILGLLRCDLGEVRLCAVILHSKEQESETERMTAGGRIHGAPSRSTTETLLRRHFRSQILHLN